MEITSRPNLKKITDDAEMAGAQGRGGQGGAGDRRPRRLKRAFESRELDPERSPTASTWRVRAAAARGAHEVLVLQVPAPSYCNDGGRRINNYESDWPDSLDRLRQDRLRVLREHTAPARLHHARRDHEFPGSGNLGDVGLYLRW